MTLTPGERSPDEAHMSLTLHWAGYSVGRLLGLLPGPQAARVLLPKRFTGVVVPGGSSPSMQKPAIVHSI
jgi:hypothetical protein